MPRALGLVPYIGGEPCGHPDCTQRAAFDDRRLQRLVCATHARPRMTSVDAAADALEAAMRRQGAVERVGTPVDRARAAGAVSAAEDSLRAAVIDGLT